MIRATRRSPWCNGQVKGFMETITRAQLVEILAILKSAGLANRRRAATNPAKTKRDVWNRLWNSSCHYHRSWISPVDFNVLKQEFGGYINWPDSGLRRGKRR